jgi:hypothetical protein
MNISAERLVIGGTTGARPSGPRQGASRISDAIANRDQHGGTKFDSLPDASLGDEGPDRRSGPLTIRLIASRVLRMDADERARSLGGLAQPGSQVHRIAWLKEVLAAKRAATTANVIALRDACRARRNVRARESRL